MEAFLSGIMDENDIPDDLMDEECCMYAPEGTYTSLSIDVHTTSQYEHIDVTPSCACRL
jgi:hypothetical protein